jgi:molybdopterin-guanine dinucleotide biosynthesis protein A
MAGPVLNPLFGILIGGRGSRMGGIAKGLLPLIGGAAETGTVLSRQLQVIEVAAPTAEVLLIGEHSAYSNVDLPGVLDSPPGVGPMGGLRALLVVAAERGRPAIAMACDMPAITAALLQRLLTESRSAPALAPKLDNRWQPLFARYDASRCLPVVDELLAQGQRALHRVLDRAGAATLELSLEEASQLRDWDDPSDIERA